MKHIHCSYALIIISTVSLLSAFYLQIELELVPCKLCIWQRWPHVINILIIVIFLTLPKNQNILVFFGLTNAVLGTLLAGYHFGLEEGYWMNVFSCSGLQGLENLNSKSLLNVLKNTPISSCEKVQWSIFGVSLAGINFLVFFILFSLWAMKGYLYFSNYESNS